MNDGTLILTLAGTIVSLVGVIVWAVKFVLHKIFGRDGDGGAWGRFMNSFDGLKEDLRRNTTALQSFETEQQKTNEVLFKLAHKGELK